MMSEAMIDTTEQEIASASAVKTNYPETLNYVERLHRLLDVIKDDLERVDIMEIDGVQL